MKEKLIDFVNKQISWLDNQSWWPDIMKTSTRTAHFVLGIYCGLLLTIFFAMGCATGMEYKDSIQANGWDKIDWWSSVIGGIVGQIIQILIIILFIILL